MNITEEELHHKGVDNMDKSGFNFKIKNRLLKPK